MFDLKTTSGFPLSIGTGIAMESLFEPTHKVYDVDRKVPNKVNINEYKCFYINISTLARNILSALDNNFKTKLITTSNHKELLEEIKYEMEVITEIFTSNQIENTKIIFYMLPYEKIESKIDNDVLSNTSGHTLLKEKLIRKVSNLILNATKEFNVSGSIKPTIDKTLILTHVGYDLLSVKNITKLDMLESHTGKLKNKYMFNTKYVKSAKSDFTIIPFYERMYYIFGDNAIVKPLSISIRRKIFDIAVKNKWTAYTSEMNVLNNIMKDPELFKIYKNFKTTY